MSAYGFCVFSVMQAQLFLENIPLCKGNRGTKAAEHENAEANGREEHTVNIFSTCRSEKGKRGEKKSRLMCANGERAADFAVFARLPGGTLQPAGQVSEEAQ